MDVLTFRLVTVIAEYLQSRTVADLLYATSFCNVYSWVLIKYQLHFDFLVFFNPQLRPYQLLYHVSWLLYYWSLHFVFFVLTSGRPLPVTTFFVFSKPLCSHFAVIREFCAPLQQRCLSLSKGFPLQCETAKICYCCSQPFYSFCSASWSHSAALQQRFLFCTGRILEFQNFLEEHALKSP